MKKRRKRFVWVLLVLVILAVSLPIAATKIYNTIQRSLYPIHYQELVEKYSEEYGLDTTLLYSIINTESSFQPDAVSSVGARGLMQLTSDTFDWVKSRLGEDESLTFDSMFDPETNIRFGSYLISYLIGRFQNQDTALAAYHAGMGNVNKWLQNEEYSSDGVTLHTIPFGDTTWYVQKINQTILKYQQLYQ